MKLNFYKNFIVFFFDKELYVNHRYRIFTINSSFSLMQN